MDWLSGFFAVIGVVTCLWFVTCWALWFAAYLAYWWQRPGWEERSNEAKSYIMTTTVTCDIEEVDE